MKRAASIVLMGLVASVAVAGTIATLPVSATTTGQIFACVNNSSGTIHVVGETSTCSNNEARLVWANQDQVSALKEAVATLQAQVAAAGHSLTSPNGHYTVNVADDGIVLQGPGVKIRLDAGNPASSSPTPTITVAGGDIVVEADQTARVKSGATTKIEAGGDTSIRSGGTIHMEGAGVVTIQGAEVNINPAH